MSSEPFRRVGRGGAGNFYTAADVKAAEEADYRSRSADLEAQKTPPAPTQAHSSPGPSYSRTGRGGAGNFTFPAAADSAEAQGGPATDAHANASAEDGETEQRTATVAAAAAAAESQPTTPAPPRPRPSGGVLGGRGGAGNWTYGGSVEKDAEAAERQRAAEEELARQALRDVEMGLAVPAPVYRGQGSHGL